MEIERKFLVKNVPTNLNDYKCKEIEQGYISTSPVIRIRRYSYELSSTITNEYVLTVKGSGRLKREEFELPLEESQYLHLLQKVETTVIKKTRYYIPLFNNLTAELDIYFGVLQGLLTVEVEFISEEAANSFTPPDWFGGDVTLDSSYSNSNLSKKV